MVYLCSNCLSRTYLIEMIHQLLLILILHHKYNMDTKNRILLIYFGPLYTKLNNTTIDLTKTQSFSSSFCLFWGHFSLISSYLCEESVLDYTKKLCFSKLFQYFSTLYFKLLSFLIFFYPVVDIQISLEQRM